jgi:hypothetical protein
MVFSKIIREREAGESGPTASPWGRFIGVWPNYFVKSHYDDFFDCLLSTYCTEGLIALSGRWIQPTQQHGRRMPSLSSVRTLSTCCLLVAGFFTEMVQQIHSLRARGVRFSHIASASGSEARVSRKSSGNSWTTPPEISLLVFVIRLSYHQIALSRKDCRSLFSTLTRTARWQAHLLRVLHRRWLYIRQDCGSALLRWGRRAWQLVGGAP